MSALTSICIKMDWIFPLAALGIVTAHVKQTSTYILMAENGLWVFNCSKKAWCIGWWYEIQSCPRENGGERKSGKALRLETVT